MNEKLIPAAILGLVGLGFAIWGGVDQNIYFFILGLYLLLSGHFAEVKVLLRGKG